jgi:hypothetical protein
MQQLSCSRNPRVADRPDVSPMCPTLIVETETSWCAKQADPPRPPDPPYDGQSQQRKGFPYVSVSVEKLLYIRRVSRVNIGPPRSLEGPFTTSRQPDLTHTELRQWISVA